MPATVVHKTGQGRPVLTPYGWLSCVARSEAITSLAPKSQPFAADRQLLAEPASQP
jgi:hypothetical protein